MLETGSFPLRQRFLVRISFGLRRSITLFVRFFLWLFDSVVILDLLLWSLNKSITVSRDLLLSLNPSLLVLLFGLFDLLLFLLSLLLLLLPPGGLPVEPFLLDLWRSFLNPFFDVGMPFVTGGESADVPCFRDSKALTLHIRSRQAPSPDTLPPISCHMRMALSQRRPQTCSPSSGTDP